MIACGMRLARSAYRAPGVISTGAAVIAADQEHS
jgi:hypothetical protein